MALAFAPRSPVLAPAARPRESPADSLSRKIAFRHPGYSDVLHQDVMFHLYAWDGQAGEPALHTGTALLACAVIACNDRRGYLTTKDASGRHVRVDSAPDGLLTGKNYWYHVPAPPSERPANPVPSNEDATDSAPSDETVAQSPYCYPVCPSFGDWVFPHDEWPWPGFATTSDQEDYANNAVPSTAPSVSTTSAAVLNRDDRCVISRSGDHLERAHLCPGSEVEWFNKNGMHTFNNNDTLFGDFATDDMANSLTLRVDVHRSFDAARFVIVPKAGGWVTHFLEPTRDLGILYHNRALAPSLAVSPAFLLARFAWAIFPRTRGFFERGASKKVKVLSQTERGLVETEKTLTSTEYAKILAGRPRGRSSSPKKRKTVQPALPDVSEVKKRKQPQPDEPETKRRRLDDIAAAVPTMTPSLASADATLPSNPSPPGAAVLYALEDEEEARLAYMRHEAVKVQRPADPALVCCDYNAAEKARALGIPGPSEWGGSHLCERCLGGEFPNDCDEALAEEEEEEEEVRALEVD